MPIYAYRCSACGHQKDVLQKLSAAPLRDCPQCGKPAMSKQVTAAGFQLKGSGWYATDFRGSSTAATASGSSSDTPSPAASPAASTTTTASTSPAAATHSCGGSCACA